MAFNLDRIVGNAFEMFYYFDFKLKTVVNPLVQGFELFYKEKKCTLVLKIGVLHFVTCQ